ncbi:hypothetical protein MRB53_036839 [Persea americana]|nr:hypothetical protein MRB53_036839 [Persea americana]
MTTSISKQNLDIGDPSSDSEDVQEFLRRIRELNEKRDRGRCRAYEESLRRTYSRVVDSGEARRAGARIAACGSSQYIDDEQNANDHSPPRRTLPSRAQGLLGTSSLHHKSPSQSSPCLSTNVAGNARTPMNPSGSSIMDAETSAVSSPGIREPGAPVLPSRAGTLSWQQRPGSVRRPDGAEDQHS